MVTDSQRPYAPSTRNDPGLFGQQLRGEHADRAAARVPGDLAQQGGTEAEPLPSVFHENTEFGHARGHGAAARERHDRAVRAAVGKNVVVGNAGDAGDDGAVGHDGAVGDDGDQREMVRVAG